MAIALWCIGAAVYGLLGLGFFSLLVAASHADETMCDSDADLTTGPQHHPQRSRHPAAHA
jgi:hypothetical protein